MRFATRWPFAVRVLLANQARPQEGQRQQPYHPIDALRGGHVRLPGRPPRFESGKEGLNALPLAVEVPSRAPD